MTLGHEVRPLDTLKKLKAIIDLKDYGLGALGSTYYEQLRVVVNMNNAGSCA